MSEQRLIDANAFKEKIIKLQKAEQNITPLAISISFDNLKTLIDSAPTAEDRYSEGYSDGYLDGMSGADMRI